MEDIENMSLKEKCYYFQNNFNFFLDPEKPILIHVDGRSFSKLVKNKFNKPFDEKFISAMNQTAEQLCHEIQGAKFAYTQSDEISILVTKDKPTSQVFFEGRMCKLHSTIASSAGVTFSLIMASDKIIKEADTSKSAEEVRDICAEIVRNGPFYTFDCKVWNVPNMNEAMNWFLFRSIDCVRNSKQQACQTYLPHDLLKNKNTDEQIMLLKSNKGIDWNKFDEGKKFGRIVKKISIPHHDNAGNVDYERSKWESFPFYDLTNIENRQKFIEEFNLIDENN